MIRPAIDCLIESRLLVLPGVELAGSESSSLMPFFGGADFEALRSRKNETIPPNHRRLLIGDISIDLLPELDSQPGHEPAFFRALLYR